MRYVVRVKPGSKKGPLVEEQEDGSLVLFVRERAVDGAANEAVLRLLAAHLGVKPGRLRLVSGQAARIKRIELDD